MEAVAVGVEVVEEVGFESRTAADGVDGVFIFQRSGGEREDGGLPDGLRHVAPVSGDHVGGVDDDLRCVVVTEED